MNKDNRERPARQDFLDQLGTALLGEDLFDAIPDTVFFVKDAKGRYVAANQALLTRTGLGHRNRILGRTAADIFPGVLGQRFLSQDKAVMESGRPLQGVLELHLYPSGAEGWCLTWKHPVKGKSGRVIGLLGISRDVRPVAIAEAELAGLSRVLDHARANLAAPLRAASLAAMAGLSTFQFDSRVRAVFGMSAAQYITRARIEEACTLLRGSKDAVSQIAQGCGYADQAAFTRAFRQSVGMTPGQYRGLHGSD